MATMTFDVNVDAGNSPKTLKSLKEELEARIDRDWETYRLLIWLLKLS